MQKRFRDFGLITGSLPTGKHNKISDISGIQVGHVTISGRVATGLTVVSPSAGNPFRQPLPAAVSVGNGYGKSTGISQIKKMGTLETPIALTSTLSVGPIMRGIVDVVIDQTPDIKPYESINAVVGETNDWILNDIHHNILTSADVRTAWDRRTSDFELGSVGAGAGTRAFSWKGGIGSASRQITRTGKTYTVGTLLQTNYGGELTMLGVPVGKLLGAQPSYSFMGTTPPDGSCMILTATDAPLTDRQLRRLAKRSLIGLARTGSIMATSSGDFVFAWSTTPANSGQSVSDDDLNDFFQAAVEATQESVYDALFTATTTKGRSGNYLEAIPVDKIVKLLKDRQV
jgi:D-aminopeptidase